MNKEESYHSSGRVLKLTHEAAQNNPVCPIISLEGGSLSLWESVIRYSLASVGVTISCDRMGPHSGLGMRHQAFGCECVWEVYIETATPAPHIPGQGGAICYPYPNLLIMFRNSEFDSDGSLRTRARNAQQSCRAPFQQQSFYLPLTPGHAELQPSHRHKTCFLRGSEGHV